MIKVKVIISDEVSGIFPLQIEKVRIFAIGVLKSTGIKNCDFNVVFINNEKMTELNEKYKNRKGPTDVLSFNISDDASDIIEGEVYVSLEKAKKQSTEYNVPYEEEIIRLVTHGLLHLAGWTHDNENDYFSMMNYTDKLVKDFSDREMS